MELSNDKMELIKVAIEQMMEDEKRNQKGSPSSFDENRLVNVDEDEGNHRHLLLSKLLSQLETLRDGNAGQPEPSINKEETPSPAIAEVESKSEAANNEVDSGDSVREDVIKELGKVQRQNFISHCLISAMIVLTLAWQLSEVSLLLKVKDGLSNPFKSLSGMVAGILKGPNVNGREGDPRPLVKQKLVESSAIASLRIPELPLVEWPFLDCNSDDD